MHESRTKLIYNLLVSLFMGYLLVNSISMFNRYFIHYQENLFAHLNIQIISPSPTTTGELTKIVNDSLIKIIPDLQANIFTIDVWDKSYEKLSNLQISTIAKLKQAGLAIGNNTLTAPVKSQRLLRLELTAAIPAFLIAIFWFFHFFKWLVYALKGSKNFLDLFQEKVKNKLSTYESLQGKWQISNKDGICELAIEKPSENGFPVKLSLSSSSMEIISHELHNHQSFSHDIDTDKFIDDTIEMILTLLSPLRRIKEIMIDGEPVKWHLEGIDYKLTEKILNKMRNRVQPEIFLKLQKMSNESYKTKEDLMVRLAEITGLNQTDDLITNTIKLIENDPEWRVLDKTHLLFYNYFDQHRTEKIYQNQVIKLA
ncbi:hypothetical protein JW964_19355 [candidate division KSB1 bacterium]|nr:hypothetical protein [candidate division KSB1 bacterium]